MSICSPKALKAIALFVAFAVAQISAQLAFAQPLSPRASLLPQQPRIVVARLVTTRDQPITVNGASASTGATILTGATIRTGDAVGATINLGALGSVDLAPNTEIRLEFDEDGKLKVTLIYGCVVVTARKKTEGEIATEQGGSQAKTDKNKGGVLDVCFPPGAAGPTIGQGAAAAAGAGALGSGGAAGAAAAATTGIGTSAIVAMIIGVGGVAFGVPIAFRGNNPSGSTP
jgi:hypothetical protein